MVLHGPISYFIHINENLFSDPTKYFGCELGAQTTMDNKNERFIVNGAHDATRLQDMLDGFIKKFVLCPQCDNPETHLVNVTIVDLLNFLSSCMNSDLDLYSLWKLKRGKLYFNEVALYLQFTLLRSV